MHLAGLRVRRWHVVTGAVGIAAVGLLILVITVSAPWPPMADGAGSGPGPVSRAEPCRGTTVRPGDDLQRVLDATSSDATVCFVAGRYRLTVPLVPVDGQRLLAAPGAVLTGAVGLDGWQQEGLLWRVRGALPAEPALHGECAKGTLCRYTETVYIDDRPLQRVASRDLVGPGRFWADYDANDIWVGDDPADRVVEVARAAAAIAGAAKNVVVRGFVIEKFANLAQRGAIQADGHGWTIERNEVRINHGTGIHVTGGQVRNNHIHHNGQLGLLGTGDGQIVEGNEIDHNNTAGFSPLWEAGGTKFALTDGLVVRGNNVHHNIGQGLWTDINNIRSTIERNVVHANTGHGIFHEISFRAVIRDNRVTANGGAEPMPGWGGAGIRVAGSPDVEIYGNTLVGNQNGIMLIQQRRDDWPSRYGAHLIRNIEVRDNQVASTGSGMTGQVDDTGSDASYGRNIRFDGNSYRLPSPDAKVFAWLGTAWESTAWQKRIGQDASSTFAVA